jgi:hypothetical protein
MNFRRLPLSGTKRIPIPPTGRGAPRNLGEGQFYSHRDGEPSMYS